jgi:Metallo-peptidase family M12B Reprolysin-like
MATSLRALADCIGLDRNGRISVLGDFFGFIRNRVPTDPDSSVTASVSLSQQFARLKGKHIHLNIIKVGLDTLSDSDEADARHKIDYAIYRIRNIYRSVNLGVGRIKHFFITNADANGRGDLSSDDEAEALWDEWTVPGSGIDVFMVRNISASFVGISPVDGNCDKNGKDDGLIGGEVGRTFEEVARTFAHEIGHFLGLPHNHGDNCPSSTSGKNNLMAQTRCAISTRNSVLLTGGQGSDMRDHCSVRNGC